MKTRAAVPPHPAVFSDELMPIFARILDEYRPRRRKPLQVLDPFAGVGTVHELMTLCKRPVETVGVELLPAWAGAHPRTQTGNARALTFAARSFDCVVTSPCYGNRMADHHQNADTCKACGGSGSKHPTPIIRCPKCNGTGISHRRSYFHYHGAKGWIEDDNAGAMQWGAEYKALHSDAWSEVARVVKPGGLFVLNIKDHVRDREWQGVPAWHRRCATRFGFTQLERWIVPTAGFRLGENGHRDRDPARQHATRGDELVYVFQR